MGGVGRQPLAAVAADLLLEQRDIIFILDVCGCFQCWAVSVSEFSCSGMFMLGLTLTAVQLQHLIDCWECSEHPPCLCRAVRGPSALCATQLSSLHGGLFSSLRSPALSGGYTGTHPHLPLFLEASFSASLGVLKRTGSLAGLWPWMLMAWTCTMYSVSSSRSQRAQERVVVFTSWMKRSIRTSFFWKPREESTEWWRDLLCALLVSETTASCPVHHGHGDLCREQHTEHCCQEDGE